MARPTKKGLDYFPLDVGFLRDKKVRLLRAEYGASSVLFVLYVWCKAYEEDGYFLKWDKDEALIAADELRESPTYISEVLRGCLSRSLFDEGVFQMFGILTSAGIQRRYLRSCEKRDDIEICSEYWLLDVEDKRDVPSGIRAKLAFFKVSGGKNQVNSPGNPVNSPGNPKSKAKERKAKESRAEQSGEEANASCAEPEAVSTPPVIALPLNDGTVYTVFEEQSQEWAGLYPAVDVIQQLRNMKGWLDSNPARRKTRRGILRFITGWLSREQNQGGRRSAGEVPGQKGNVFLDMLREEERRE